jgi:hypothetical protein
VMPHFEKSIQQKKSKQNRFRYLRHSTTDENNFEKYKNLVSSTIFLFFSIVLSSAVQNTPIFRPLCFVYDRWNGFRIDPDHKR